MHTEPEAVPAVPTASPLPRSPYAAYNAAPEPLRGEDVRLIRPYFLAHERAEYARVTHERRRAAGLATLGIDVGPDVIHGVRLPA
ncbi:hypothetical protein [Streptomyces sp. DH10]|uniref:hypothetical protein n=1 Tax=Streptomyces sp. DH10 TaxID=3040121 RepID=UPI00244190E2|nr:hypothetical protein [Streptomyces sp. DH10]MDG9713020.1 hypothetical protein [Streptomyces sp. DH10]